MSHFVTLVNFYMPKLEENCEENMRYAEQKSKKSWRRIRRVLLCGFF